MLILDRFENEIAVLSDEEGSSIEIKKALLPNEAKEGDVIVPTEGGFSVDREETEKRRRETLDLLRKMGL